MSAYTKKYMAFYGLKWNPFSSEIPTEGLRINSQTDHFAWRVENLAQEGGFAQLMGPAGTGKSVTLRFVKDRLSRLRDVHVAELVRPQAGLADFYRELGDVFGVKLTPHNRWTGTKALRGSWKVHLDTSLFRPVLLVDEAQEMQPAVLKELRLLSSADFDSRLLLTVVLAGDHRLADKLRSDDLLPLASRIRVRLMLEAAAPEELAEHLRHVTTQAGNASLMTSELVTTLSEHAGGNLRAMMHMADELLVAGARKEVTQLDEKLYLEVFATPTTAKRAPNKRARGGRR